MYVCLCNPFTDKDVRKALSDEGVKKTPGQVYKACSGGQKPCCGTCLCMIREQIEEHKDHMVLMAAE